MDIPQAIAPARERGQTAVLSHLQHCHAGRTSAAAAAGQQQQVSAGVSSTPKQHSRHCVCLACAVRIVGHSPQEQVKWQSMQTPPVPASTSCGCNTAAFKVDNSHHCRGCVAGQSEQPSFGQLLADSLQGDGSTQRGWFDDERRYQLLQQSRCPLSLPQVINYKSAGSRLPTVFRCLLVYP